MTATFGINLTHKGRPLLQGLLEQQQDLTAVERFAQRHAQGLLPAQQRYRELLPLTRPQAGQQYAFEVDLDACTGCKACVTACHNQNGLDEGETFRDVGLLIEPDGQPGLLQHLTSACHHCLEPACLEGCPVEAYEKDASTGIVRHLDDQCIGCQYCVLKCPYDAPKYNARLGIVRKCDMCSSRLAAGEPPACAAACPGDAIRIRIVDVADARKAATRGSRHDGEPSCFVPGAADPDYTLPTTLYRRRESLPRGTRPADHHRVRPQHGHPALVFMLVLTQLAVGTLVVGQLLPVLLGKAVMTEVRGLQAGLALGLGVLALATSTLHLGRPLYAFRAVLGLRRSWLSREIVAFGIFAALASLYAVAAMPAAGRWALVPRGEALPLATAAAGLLGVFCSAMVYHDTRRPLWHIARCGPRFLLSAAALGLATTLLAGVGVAAHAADLDFAHLLERWGSAACLGLAAIISLKLALESAVLGHLAQATHTPLRRTAMLLTGPLLGPVVARYGLALLGGVVLPLGLALGSLASGPPSAAPAAVAVVAFACVLAGELVERYLFFAAVTAPKMPGGIGS